MKPSLFHLDCFDLFPRIPDNSIDAIVSDPPYAMTNLPWDKSIDWPEFWREAERICADHAVIVLFSAQPFTTALINSNRKRFRYEIIWEKSCATGFLNANRRPLTAHENIVIFAQRPSRTIYNPQKSPGRPFKGSTGPRALHYANTPKIARDNPTGDRHPRSVLHFASIRGGHHPTEKPLELMRWLVRTYTNRGGTILDPFMGSGSTGVAAVTERRHFIGCERDAVYYETALNRITECMDSPNVDVRIEV